MRAGASEWSQGRLRSLCVYVSSLGYVADRERTKGASAAAVARPPHLSLSRSLDIYAYV